LLVWASAPVLLFFYVVMIRVCDAESHWPMVGYIPLAVAAGAFLDEKWDGPARTLRGLVKGTAAISLGAFALYFIHAESPAVLRVFPPALYHADADPINETLGWDRFARAVSFEAKTAGPGTVVVGAHNVLCGHAAVALDGLVPAYCASPRRTEFDFIGRRDPPDTAPVVYFDSPRYPESPAVALPGRSCVPAQSVDVTRDRRLVNELRLWTCAPRSSADQAMLSVP
jgi:hypothetical protein